MPVLVPGFSMVCFCTASSLAIKNICSNKRLFFLQSFKKQTTLCFRGVVFIFKEIKIETAGSVGTTNRAHHLFVNILV